MNDPRRLTDLVSVGRAVAQDFARMGITSVSELAIRDAQELYEALFRLDGLWHDPCMYDTLQAAIAQARDPDLPFDQRQWWYYSRQRKAQGYDPRVTSENDRVRPSC